MARYDLPQIQKVSYSRHWSRSEFSKVQWLPVAVFTQRSFHSLFANMLLFLSSVL